MFKYMRRLLLRVGVELNAEESEIRIANRIEIRGGRNGMGNHFVFITMGKLLPTGAIPMGILMEEPEELDLYVTDEGKGYFMRRASDA